jgi:predicted small lipoprotein YifL
MKKSLLFVVSLLLVAAMVLAACGPKTEVPPKEDPKVEDPVVEEPPKEDPKVEDPVVEEPTGLVWNMPRVLPVVLARNTFLLKLLKTPLNWMTVKLSSTCAMTQVILS